MKNLDESHYKPDFEISDRYINFSSELLRLSLLALSGLGAAFLFFLEKKPDTKLTPADKGWLFATVLLFALTTGASLFHRFYASDCMSYHIAYLRTNDEAEKKGRELCLKRAKWFLILAEYLFGIAVIAFAIALFLFLLK